MSAVVPLAVFSVIIDLLMIATASAGRYSQLLGRELICTQANAYCGEFDHGEVVGGKFS